MMTTGYDCPDILNLGLMRPIFSPSDFIQIKGRGTRKHNFFNDLTTKAKREEYKDCQKKSFKLFDFFANCEYFEEKYDYDEVLKLPTGKAEKMAYAASFDAPIENIIKEYEHHGTDDIASIEETQIGKDGMKIDRMFFDRFREKAESDDTLRENVNNGEWQKAEDYLNEHIFNKPNDYFTLDKLRKSLDAQRHTTIKDILQKIFGHITQLPSKDDVAGEKFEAFILKYNLQSNTSLEAIRYFFKSYLTDSDFRQIIETNKIQDLYSNAGFGIKDYKAVPDEWRKKIPEYIKDYVSLNQFM
jgi:type I restriction enzyme R subunit